LEGGLVPIRASPVSSLDPDILLDLMRPRFEGETNDMLTTATFGDLTATEVVVLVAAFRPAYERLQVRTKNPAIPRRVGGNLTARRVSNRAE